MVYHARFTRCYTHGAFTNRLSRVVYDAPGTDGLNTKGYYGGVFDGRYIYFSPVHNGALRHGIVLRYDTYGGLTNATSWQVYDASNTDGLSCRGYRGGVYDGRYIYYVPHYDGTNIHANVLRYDTRGVFTNSANWQACDVGNTGGLTCKGYVGVAFDGRFLYFSPRRSAFATYHGHILRFDSRWPHRIPSEISGGSCY